MATGDIQLVIFIRLQVYGWISTVRVGFDSLGVYEAAFMCPPVLAVLAAVTAADCTIFQNVSGAIAR